ncbi:MAG: diguanylate cyclase (GGDEF)-like protein/PAS domain S-box-containing protein [Lentisphaeria bacterium]
MAACFICSNNIKADSPTTLGSSTYELSAEEKAWLLLHPQVTFTGDPNWLPYEAFTREGEYIGIVAEYIKLISDITDLNITIVPSKTWTGSTEKAKLGQVDILSDTNDSDLKSHLNFTQPYLFNPIVIAMGINQHYVENIDNIANKRIALIKGHGYAAKIRRKYTHINFVTVNDIQDGIISISTGKVDALLCTLALCSYTINQLGINNVKIVGKTEFDTKLAFGVQKKYQELLSILNKAIQNISERQQQGILDQWVKQDAYIEKVDYALTYIIAFVSFILISAFVYWNRRLSNEIILRQEGEKELKALANTNERYRVLFYESPVGHALNELSTGKFISVNQAFSSITGYSTSELNSLSYWDLTPESYAADEQKQLNSLNESGFYGHYEKHYIHKNGLLIDVRLNGSLITAPSGEKLILSVVENISPYADALKKLHLSSLVLENSSEGMIVTDANNHIIAINPAFSHITGYRLEEVRGKKPSIFSSTEHDADFYTKLWLTISKTGHWQGEVWDKNKTGEVGARWVTINTTHDKDGTITRHVILFSDITSRKHSEEIIWKQANFDDLTGLPNRSMFRNRLQMEIALTKRSKRSFALLLIDLDQFKEVNDTLGHLVGDQLLRITGRRIQKCVRETDTVARIGGDEFTIILAELHANSDVVYIAQQLVTQLAKPYALQDEVVHVSASIGITLYPNDAEDIDTLIQNADQAMYEAKNAGRNQVSHFTQALQDQAQKRLRLSNDLRSALAREQFEVYFQPVVDLATGKIHKAEALLRWFHPERGLVSPLEFISIAEDIGIINEIGNWVCYQGEKWQRNWSALLDANFQVGINMSPLQFKADQEVFCGGWLSPKYANEAKYRNIIIEITEGMLLHAEPEVLEKLYRLRDIGVEVAIDDFGTGYSSLSYLKKFDIDYLKIDQSFTKNIETAPNDLALCEAIIIMAHTLGLKVIAEGVETKQQENILSSAKCDFAQGYLYSKPVPPKEFEQLIRVNRCVEDLQQ